MTVQIHNVDQGTDEWLLLRLGRLTASTMREILTPTLQVASNEKQRMLAYKIASQRISGVIEDTPVTDAMLRGHIDEGIARRLYSEKYTPVEEAGFITNERFPGLGYSPDGLVGDHGLIEVKSRAPHLQVKTIATIEAGRCVPDEFMAQIQTGLLVSERDWCDFISFSHGLPMMVSRVFPDPEYLAAIESAWLEFETTVGRIVDAYRAEVRDSQKYTPTERVDYEGMIL